MPAVVRGRVAGARAEPLTLAGAGEMGAGSAVRGGGAAPVVIARGTFITRGRVIGAVVSLATEWRGVAVEVFGVDYPPSPAPAALSFQRNLGSRRRRSWCRASQRLNRRATTAIATPFPVAMPLMTARLRKRTAVDQDYQQRNDFVFERPCRRERCGFSLG